MAQLNFDATLVKPQQSFDALPAGKYEVIITESEMKATKSGSGEYLQLTFEVVNNENFDGRKLWSRLNLVNDNKTAVEIAERELSAICHCVRVLSPNDSEELHDKPLIVDVVQEMGPSGSAINRIKGYRMAGEEITQKPAKPVVKTAKSGKPWGNN